MKNSVKKQFILFCIVGVSNTVLSYVIYSVVLLSFKKLLIFRRCDYIVSQVLAFFLSVAWSFYWNNKLVFKSKEKRNVIIALLRTYISYSFTGLFVNNVLLYVWVEIFEISEFVAPIISLLISVPLNFLLNKFWAFKETSSLC